MWRNHLTKIIIPGLRGFSVTLGSLEKNPRRVTLTRFHLRETAFVSFKVKVEGEGEHAQLASLGGYSDFTFFSPQSTPNRASVSSGERSPSPFASPPIANSKSLLGEKSPKNLTTYCRVSSCNGAKKVFVLASVSMKPLGGGVGKIRMAAEADNANARTPAETWDAKAKDGSGYADYKSLARAV